MSDIEKEVIEKFGTDIIDPDYGCISWSYLVKHKKLTEDQIIKYRKFLSLSDIVQYQKLSEEFLENYEEEIVDSNLWEDIMYYQILSDDFIIKYYNKIKRKTDLVFSQRCCPGVIKLLEDSLFNEEYLSSSFTKSEDLYRDLLENQYLEEDWIIENKDKLKKDINSLIYTQRLTPRIISEFNIDLKDPNIYKNYNQNQYRMVEIGKDWFITYAYPNTDSFIDYWVEIIKEDIDYSYDDIVISKVRVYYSDIVINGVFKKVDIIRTYGPCKDINFYKI